MPGFVRHFVSCNQHDFSHFTPLYIGGEHYGYVPNDLAEILPKETGLFIPIKNGIALDPALTDFRSRSEAFSKAAEFAVLRSGKKLRHELYAVTQNWDDEPIAQIDRAAIPIFGMRAWGVHVNGYVRRRDGIHLWIGERADDRPADPGKLDNIIGGGQPFGLTPEENLCKEAREEAGVSEELALTANLANSIKYVLERSGSLRRDTLFVYDLELPASFTPLNTDGEVAAFHLLPLAEVATIIRDTDKFKFNCNMVIIDFLMRHGFFMPGDEEYEELENWLTGSES